MEVKSINLYNTLSNPSDSKFTKEDKAVNFSMLLNNALNRVNELQLESEEYNTLLSIGEVDNLHDVTIATEKANVALQLTLSIRNKIVEASFLNNFKS